jgi:PAS domain S-box-containing protein
VEQICEESQLELNLRKAVERKEFQLYYQPKVNLSSGKIGGVEALIRWKHPNRGIISPLEFIPLAEETGLILPIGEWVLREACEQNKKWRDMGLPPMVMSVNLSARQFFQDNLVEKIEQILNDTGISPKFLELEITESMMMDAQYVSQTLWELKRLGIRISLDDFGTGYSSLYYLKNFPIDKIKIDQSFVQNCTNDTKDATIVKAIIAMSHQLKIEVVAEGIETKEHLIFLQQNLCNKGQGYFFSKPLPPDKFIRDFILIEGILKREGISQELSEQKWLEEALKYARQELLDTVRQQQGMIFKFKEKNGKFIHTLCDGELLYRMNLTSEQVVGRELKDFMGVNDAKSKLNYYQRAWNGEEVTYEGNFNGIWYIASLRPIRTGGHIVEVIGSCVDITEKKKIEEDLKSSEYRYRIIAENTQDLIRVIDINGIICYASPSHETVLGFPKNVYEGSLFYELIHPDDVDNTKKAFSRIISLTPQQVEFRYKHADGRWIFVESKGTPVLNEQGEIECIVIVGRDISERKKTEELIRKSERLSVAGKMAAGIAHEIRNPLTSIKGFVQLLQNEVEKPLYMKTIFSEIYRIEEIINEFLLLDQPPIYQFKEIKIGTLLQQVFNLFYTQTTLKNVEIVQEYRSDITNIDCVESQIKQVFIHILQNAVEAMPNGGKIKVRILNNSSEYIIIRFIDEGIGISEERMRNIGVPFYSIKEKGTGFGLMICNKIIQEHGGEINIISEINKGTTVDILLPIKQTCPINK